MLLLAILALAIFFLFRLRRRRRRALIEIPDSPELVKPGDIAKLETSKLMLELEAPVEVPRAELEAGHPGASEAEAREIYELPAEAHDAEAVPRLVDE